MLISKVKQKITTDINEKEEKKTQQPRHTHSERATAKEKQTLSTLLVSCAVSYKNKTGEVQTQ